MIDSNTLKVGDKIVNFGHVHEIFKISKEKTNGKARKVVHFRPFFENPQNKGLTCSIPLKNISKAEIRRPFSKKFTKELYEDIKKRVNVTEFPDVNQISTMFNTNDPKTLVRVLKILNKEKKSKENGLSTSKKTIYEKLIESISQEYAYVKNISIENAKKKLQSALK